MKSKVKSYIFPVLAVLTVSAFPSLFLYCRNADEAGFSEIVPALLVSVAAGLILFGLALLFTRDSGKAAISASLLMLVILNFTFLENGLKLILPRLKYWHTVPIILVLALHIIYFLCHYLKNETAGDVTKILCLVFGGLLIFNVATSTPQIINHIQAQRELKHALAQREEQQGTTTENMPNVYLVIFDEYANFPQLEEYYNYDNALLMNFFEKHNFNISYTSHNESIFSSTIQTNLVNLDYIVDNYTDESRKEVLRKDGALFHLMQAHGYDVRIFEASNFYGGTLPSGSAVSSGASTVDGEGLADILLERSVFYPIRYFEAAENSGYAKVENFWIMTDYFEDANNIPDSNCFTLAYYGLPHGPFYVDENGNLNPTDKWTNWKDDSAYLGQLKYTTNIMLKLLTNIINNDPNAIIMLQSDHGARGALANGGLLNKFPLDVMNNPLNAVYYKADIVDIEGLSSVNTVRRVLSLLFDENYDELMVPPDDYPYEYKEG